CSRIVGQCTIIDDEEAFAGDCKIQRSSSRLCAARCMYRIDRRDLHTSTDLTRVRATTARGWRACTLDLLADHIFKRDTAFFETVRVHVRNVVTDDVQFRLESSQSRNA